MKIKNIKVEVGENKFNPNITCELSISYDDLEKFQSMVDCDAYVGKEIRETIEAWADVQTSLMNKKAKASKPKKRSKK